MKKPSKPANSSDDIRPEYDFSAGVRGKYAERFREGANIVVLDPDVAAEFKDSKSVNDALRTILKTRVKR
jgi:ABC-type tungstate transport system permease subunit